MYRYRNRKVNNSFIKISILINNKFYFCNNFIDYNAFKKSFIFISEILSKSFLDVKYVKQLVKHISKI